MKCKDCVYANAKIIADPDDIKCEITGEIRSFEEECNCEFTRSLHDNRTGMTENGAEAANSIIAFGEQINNGFKLADIKYVYTTLLDVVNEGIVSDKLNEVIKYLEEYL